MIGDVVQGEGEGARGLATTSESPYKIRNFQPAPKAKGFYRLSRDPVFNPCAFARIARHQLKAWNNLYNLATDMKVTCTMNGKWML